METDKALATIREALAQWCDELAGSPAAIRRVETAYNAIRRTLEQVKDPK